MVKEGLRVALDVGALRRPETGIGRYTGSLLEALAESFPRGKVVGFLGGPAGRSRIRVPADVPLFTMPIPRRLLHALWRRLGWPTIETVVGPVDVFHTSDWSHPPQRGGATVTTVHDLGPLDHPEWYAPEIVELHERHNRATVDRAHRIIAISDFTKQRFLEHFPSATGRVVTVPSGVGADFASLAGEQESRTPTCAALPDRYVLYVGTGEARKNLPGLVRIFERVAHRDPDVALVLVGMTAQGAAGMIHGAEAWTADPVSSARDPEALRGRVHRIGHVSRNDLLVIYRKALALVFPTLYEGFGLPLLEAMASGCPVIASSTSAVPEVVGDAGILRDPEDEGGFAHAVVEAISDPSVLGGLRNAGVERARDYTWDRTAALTRSVYLEAARG